MPGTIVFRHSCVITVILHRCFCFGASLSYVFPKCFLALIFIAAVSCGSPTTVPHSQRHGDLLTYTNYITYTCNSGFVLTGNRRLQCQANGSWSGTVPTCTPVTCPNLTPPLHGHANSTNFSFSSVISFKCNLGFLVVGATLSQCLSDGNWSHRSPSCMPVQCPQLTPAEHSVILRQNSSFQGQAISECLPGYVRESGDFQRQCLKDGAWNGTDLYCKG